MSDVKSAQTNAAAGFLAGARSAEPTLLRGDDADLFAVAVPSGVKLESARRFFDERLERPRRKAGVGALYQMPVRLRYRVSRGEVTFALKLHLRERVFADAFDEAASFVQSETDLPVYYGKREGDR